MEKRTQQGKLTNLEIASLCSEMAMILKYGISSLEGVDLLREDAQTKAEKELLDEIYQSVMNTGRLDQALEETKVFPEYLIRMTQIGEETGTLDEVMESLAEHYDREEAIRRSVRSAISYPLLMIGMMLVIIIILMTKVMPVFDQVFRQFGQEMTGFSRGILLAGNALSRYSAVFAVLLAVIEPDHRILTMIASHFADRLNPERFMIYDKGHCEVMIHVPEQPWYIRALTVQECEQLDVLLEQKEEYVILWKTFFDSICIHERRNDSLQTNMAPKKYRTHMTEFQPEQQ